MNESPINGGTGAATPPRFEPSASTPEPSTPETPVQSPPAVRAVPLVGFWAWWYNIGARFGKHWMRARSKGDQKKLDDIREEADQMHASFVEAIRKYRVETELVAGLRAKTNEVRRATIAFFGTKGAAATTTNTTLFSATLAEDGRVIVTLVDGNPAEGTAAARLGMNDGDTVTIQTLAGDLKGGVPIRQRRFADEMSKARPSVNGVRVISADSIMEEERRLSGEGMANVLSLLNDNSEYVTVDTANDIGEVQTRKVAERADVFVFTANVGIPDSLRHIATGMEAMRLLGFEEKVKHSVVVISNIPEGDSIDSYRKYLNKVDMEYEVKVKLDHKFEGVFMGVYTDPYIALDRVVDLEKLSWQTRQTYREMNISVLDQVKVLRDQTRQARSVTALPAARMAGGQPASSQPHPES